MHLLTDGDALQSHRNLRIFTRQLQWCMQQCKRILNHEAAEEAAETTHGNIQAVSFQPAVESGEQRDSDSDTSVVLDRVEAVTTSTNASDDYAHRLPVFVSCADVLPVLVSILCRCVACAWVRDILASV